MRLKPNHISLLVIAILVTVNLSFAQESGSPVLEGMEPEKSSPSSSNGSEIIYTDGEGSAQRVQSNAQPFVNQSNQNNQSSTLPVVAQPSGIQRESTPAVKPVTQQPKPKSQSKQSEEETKPEDSVLGFNFLYYIFQKYKMSDIID